VHRQAYEVDEPLFAHLLPSSYLFCDTVTDLYYAFVLWHF